MSFSWTRPYPELYKICVLFERTELATPSKWSYHPLPSYLQNGPQCGLVALAMLMGSPLEDTINRIFNYAKKMDLTYNGEIFSADFMHSLAKHFLVSKNLKLHSGSLNDNQIKNFLLAGGEILVPYDTNKDNSPGLHGGHKAHWCAVSGAIETTDDFFVLARHGKARNVAIWKLDALAASNQQLCEFSPDRKMQDVKYKLPEGGLNGPLGLNSKFVLCCVLCLRTTSRASCSNLCCPIISSYLQLLSGVRTSFVNKGRRPSPPLGLRFMREKYGEDDGDWGMKRLVFSCELRLIKNLPI